MMGSVNYMTTIIQMRAPGMTMFRMPLTIWAMFITAILQAFALPVLTAAGFMQLTDRSLRHRLFPSRRGWSSTTPSRRRRRAAAAVAAPVLVLLAPGRVHHDSAGDGHGFRHHRCFARKPIFGYKPMVYSIAAIAGLGFIVWGHHMFVSGHEPGAGHDVHGLDDDDRPALSAVKVFNWLGTIWGGNIQFTRRCCLPSSFVSMFIIGGLSGIFMAATPVDIFIHDTYFIVAHFHYVLFGARDGVFGAIYFWFPKMFGRMMNEHFFPGQAALLPDVHRFQRHVLPDAHARGGPGFPVCTTFPLIWVGGLVTTYDAGMAVPDWPTTYGYNMFLYPYSTWLSGPWDLFIEHGHRLLASFVGMLTIGLVVATWRYDHRRWVRWYSVLCLLLVISQGLLGGFRVLLDANLLARLHGCLGPLFFAFSIGAASVTSRWWHQAAETGAAETGAAETGAAESRAGERSLRVAVPSERAASLQRLAWTTTGIALLQLILGAHLRHITPTWPPDVFRAVVLAHLVGAFLLAVHAGLIATNVWRATGLRADRRIRFPANLLVALVALQLIAGAATWRVKYFWPEWLPQPLAWQGYAVQAESMLQTITVTLHVAMGSLILGMAVVLAIRCSRILTHQTLIRATASAANLREVVA
jgi:heme A synthase